MTARFTAGVYLTVALGSAAYILGTGNGGTAGPIIVLDRPFTSVWFFLYIVSMAGGFYYHFVHPRRLMQQGASA